MIVRVGDAPHQARFREAVDQFDGAVVADSEPFGQLSDRDRVPDREALDRQQRLMLARGQADGARGILAERSGSPRRRS